MNKEEFTTLVKTDKGAPETREGRTPLFLLPSTPELADILSELDLSDFNEEEMKTLNTFIFFGKFTKDEKSKIAKNWLRFINKSLRGTDNKTVYSRGLLYRFIAYFDGETLPIEKLLSDTSLEKQYPWIWVDGIWRQRWDTASNKIATLVHTEQGCSDLFGRFPLYKQNQKKSVLYSSMIKWYENMNATDKTIMSKCLEFLGLPNMEEMKVDVYVPSGQKSVRERLEVLFPKKPIIQTA